MPAHLVLLQRTIHSLHIIVSSVYCTQNFYTYIRYIIMNMNIEHLTYIVYAESC